MSGPNSSPSFDSPKLDSPGESRVLTVPGPARVTASRSSSAPRIALAVNTLLGGGAERVIVNLARGLVERGVKVDVVLLRAVGPYLERLPREVEVVDLQCPYNVRSAILPYARYLRSRKPDALSPTLKESCAAALLAKRLTRVPTRVVPVITAMYLERSLVRRYSRQLLYQQAHRVIAVSEGIADDFASMSRMARERIEVVYNPIVDDELFRLAALAPDHPWLEPEELARHPVVLTAGRLTWEKDHKTLIRAVAEVRQSRPVRLVILGEGPERRSLEDLVRSLGLAEAVAMPGFATNPFAAMARASVFALSSVSEGLSNVLIEALALGVPLVATDCRSGPREILSGGKYGLLTPPGDASVLARAILAQLDAARNAPPQLARARDFAIPHITGEYLRVMGFSG